MTTAERNTDKTIPTCMVNTVKLDGRDIKVADAIVPIGVAGPLTPKQAVAAVTYGCTHIMRMIGRAPPRLSRIGDRLSGFTVHVLGTTHPHAAGEVGTTTLGLTPRAASAGFFIREAVKVAKRGTETWQRVVRVLGAGYRNEDDSDDVWPFCVSQALGTRYSFADAVAMRDALRAAKLPTTMVRLRPRAVVAATVVFVYGSLLRGLHNHHYLDGPGVTFLGATTTLPSYTMIAMGGYPGLLMGGTTAIRGECYAVNAGQLARLDRLEGHPTYYRRIRVDAVGYPTAVGYVLPQARGRVGAPVVTTGDWKAYHTERAA